LSLVAAIESQGTLTTDTEGKVSAALFVDERATDPQEKALIGMASELAPSYLKTIVKVKRSRIAFKRQGLRATLQVGDKAEAKVETRALDPHRDVICGNEAQTYPPLSQGARVECAKTLENFYGGPDLAIKWSEPNARSAMVGTFSL
jgi:hypothetical protein